MIMMMMMILIIMMVLMMVVAAAVFIKHLLCAQFSYQAGKHSIKGHIAIKYQNWDSSLEFFLSTASHRILAVEIKTAYVQVSVC